MRLGKGGRSRTGSIAFPAGFPDTTPELAVTQMDEVTQQNAALVEQASAAAQALSEQAGSLRDTVAVFRLQAA